MKTMHHLNSAEVTLLAAHLMHVQMRKDVRICANMCQRANMHKCTKMCKLVNVHADRVQKLLNSSC